MPRPASRAPPVLSPRLRCHGPCCVSLRFLSIVARATKPFHRPLGAFFWSIWTFKLVLPQSRPHAAVAFWRGSAALALDRIFVQIDNWTSFLQRTQDELLGGYGCLVLGGVVARLLRPRRLGSWL